ncbi:MAG TPA: hypothetical protein VGT41_04945 [Candidatus Babeliales bacterium]|nr:hypothetical protein [Candidatus Babeliales bacterium]
MQTALTATKDAIQDGNPSALAQDAAALEQAGEAISMAAVQAAMESYGWAGALTPFLEQLATTIGEVAAEAAAQAAEVGFEFVPLGEVAF